MNTELKSIAAIGMLTSLIGTAAEAAIKKRVSFESQGKTLAGNLYLPDDYREGEKLPAVVITGAWTTVKEQMPATYAAKLADNGYAALTFDFRGWGASEGEVKYLESPAEKTKDIHAAVAYLSTRAEVDMQRIGGLGICASAGYMGDAAASNPRMKAFALVAPWLHDAAIVEATYGGLSVVNSLIEASRRAAASSEPVYLEAASTTNENAVMQQAPYYTDPERGFISEYDNRFNAASWEPWLTYDALKTASVQTKPGLLVHSEAAAIPEGAKAYAALSGKHVQLLMLDEVTQFDFYDDTESVQQATKAVVNHFKSTL